METKEYGIAVACAGPYPPVEEKTAELREVAKRILTKNYEVTRERLAGEGIDLDQPQYLDGPVLRKYAEYDEKGVGIGDPLPDVADYHFAWHAWGTFVPLRVARGSVA